MSSGLFSGASGLALGVGLYKGVSGLWGGASGLIDGFGGEAFSPASLFAAGEPGAWYDPSDLTTMFQDTAGTTPVTATGQTVALLLDKSQGLVLGPELVSNSGPFSNTTGYTAFQGTLAASGGNLVATATVANDTRTAVQIPVVIGAYYRVTVVVAAADAGTVSVGANFTTGSIIFTQSVVGSSASSGTITILAVATNTFMNVVLRNTGLAIGQSFSISSVSAKELPGNHATQATAASRPIYGIEPFGGRRNLLTFTEQFDNAAWTKTNTTVSGDSTTAPDGTLTADTITLTGTSIGVRQLASSSALARCYSFYVKNNSGARYFQILTDGTANAFANFDIQSEVVGSRGSSASASSITSAGNGWYRIQMTATDASATNIYISLVGSNTAGWSTGASSGSFYVWGAQLETGSTATAYQRVTDQWNVTQAGVASVSYLAFDGTDDFMLTGTITPGIDKAQVFAGVRKLSDVASGVLCEFSAGSGSGRFEMFAPLGAASPNYQFSSRGTAGPSITATPFAAPTTNVVTSIGDIAGDVATLRVNGVQAATSATDQGSGNYLAYPLYIGRRAGTANPFNGRIYSLIVRFGANLAAGTITETENWVGGETGVYTLDQLNLFATLDASGVSYNAYGAADADSNYYLVPKTVLDADGTPYSVL